jgi:hypothetical protein
MAGPMCAVFISASLLVGGFLSAWALLGAGAAIDPRTAARVFGWLCLASALAGSVFMVRPRTAYDRAGAALLGAIATTLLIGAATLYLSYFEWTRGTASAAPSVPATIAMAREVAPPPLPVPASLPRTSHTRATPARESRTPSEKSAAVGNSANVQHTLAATACSGLKGLALHQCLRCPNETGLSGFVCHENARAEYCARRDGSEPGCPWLRPAAMTD